MEPRIATLLGDSPLDRPAQAGEALSWIPPPSAAAAPRRPHPLEPTTANDHARANSASTGPSLLAQGRHQQSPSQPPAAAKRQKPGAPIAGVLNTVTPFSGRLSDLLLDPSQQQSYKRKRADEPGHPPAPSGAENALLKLPKPHQQPKRNTKRPRIPPLLQGLHQPPPQSRLFPPITSESGAFGRDLGDGVGLPTISGSELGKEQTTDNPVNARSESRSADAQHGKPSRKATETTPASTSDKENRTDPERAPKSTGTTGTKESRKRNKWSDQETKDLLVGVSRFGIGNWKKILQCPDFTFHQRTAVDLKDRFRTCCPGEGLKARKPKRKEGASDNSSQNAQVSSTTSSMSSSQDNVTEGTSTTTATAHRKNRGDSHRKGPAELREMGIHNTFVKSNRRKRRAFTDKDDQNLLKGFEKHGSSWHLMRDDEELDLSTRQPTDLRDRFRIRYPEKFAEAGYKPKPKDAHILEGKKKGKERDDNKHTSNSQGPGGTTKSGDSLSSSGAKHSTADVSSSLISTAPANTHLMPLALRESFLTSFSGPLEDFGDLASEDDVDNSRSPIILNRNIFEWADANPSQMTPVSASNLPSMGMLANDGHPNIVHGTDSMHINPMVTLNLPMALLNSNILSSFTSQSSAPHPSAPSRFPEPYQHTTASSAAPTSTIVSTTKLTVPPTKQSTNHLLRTPNLPTIVFPPVPASSARSAVHNLPPPADLLSGLDADTRPEMQTASFMLDDGLGFTGAGMTYPQSATLAPMNGISGREMLTLEKGLLQEPGLDKRG